MKYLLCLSICLISLLPKVVSQETDKMEIITHTDGSIFNGEIVESDDSYILFRLFITGDTINLERSLIKSWIGPENNFIYNKGKYHNKKGTIKAISFYYGTNADAIDETMQADIIYAKLINPSLGLGMGLGYSLNTILSTSWHSMKFGEISIYGRYYVNENQRRFFTDIKLGASLSLESKPWLSYTSGPHVQPGLGFQFATKHKIKWAIMLRQFFQRSKIYSDTDFFDSIVGGRSTRINTTRTSDLENRILSRTLLGISLIF